MKVMGVDPGKTTGVALLDDGVPIEVGEVKYENMLEWLDQQSPDVWVVEDYYIEPVSQRGYSHQWNPGLALRVIGMVLYRAAHTGKPLHLQRSSIKPVAAAYLGKVYKKKSGNHIEDAALHASYWWKRHVEGK